MISDTSADRTFADIDEVLNLAKLKKEDLLPVTQSVYFKSDDIENGNLRLLKLDFHLLKEIQVGQTLIFKGDQGENAVLCSKSKTYDINDTETSNSLLLMEGLKFSDDCKGCDERSIVKVKVQEIFYNYLEPVLGKPYLKKLENLLNDSLYRGPEHESEIDESKLFTFDELDTIIQSSTLELKEALANMDVVTINNKVRLLAFEYHVRVLSYMLGLIDENSWDIDEIQYDTTLDSLKDIVPKDVIESLFEKYTLESKVIDGETLYAFKEKEVCVLFAKALLNEAGKFKLDEFLEAWKESVPQGMIPDEDMLYGIAIIDRRKVPHGIWGFSESTLTDNINERFRALFEVKEKWTVPEITPYIKKLATEKLDVNALLAKHARAFKEDGIKYYCAKHSK